MEKKVQVEHIAAESDKELLVAHNESDLAITLDKKAQLNDDSTFYRFTMLNGNIIIWFSLHNDNHIYTIGITTGKLFPVSGVQLFAETDGDEPFYFKRVIIDPYSLNDDIQTTKKYIEELELACAIGQAIENFFRNEFLQKYGTKKNGLEGL
jgi:hypothetical protein